MAFVDSEPVSGAGRRDNSAILATATLLAGSGWAALGGVGLEWAWAVLLWVPYLHQPATDQ
jgi:hypothetical protein